MVNLSINQKTAIIELVWKAINRKSINTTWTSRDIAYTTETLLRNVSLYLTRFRRAGHIKRIGTAFDRCAVYKRIKKIPPYWLDK